MIDMGFVLMPEVPQRAENGIGRGHPQAAETGIADILSQFLKQLDIPFAAISLGDPGQDLQEPLGADPAGNALTAGLGLGELQEELGNIDHTVGLVQDHHTAGAHHRSHGFQAFIIDRQIDMLLRDAAARGAAGLDGLEQPVALDAATDVENDVL